MPYLQALLGKADEPLATAPDIQLLERIGQNGEKDDTQLKAAKSDRKVTLSAYWNAGL